MVERTRLLIGACVALVMALATAGCVGSFAAPTPMRKLEYANPAGPAKCLFVLLPGRGDRAATFEKRGFIAELRAHELSADIHAADVTFGYYMRATMVDRLSTDVIEPAKARGYQEIWLAGPSMGGFGSLLYTRARPADVSGVLAIAPYLGDDKIIDEITAAGGLQRWQAPPRPAQVSRHNYQPELWRWLQAVTQGREAAPPIYLVYGKADRMAPADELLRAELPPARVFLTEGEHEWGAWRRVLKAFLESPEFAGHCRADASMPAAHVTPANAQVNASADAAACAARGGEIRPICRRQIPTCLVPHADAGKRCSDKSDCEGRCLADPDSPARPGEPATGRCAVDDDPCGCKFDVKQGRMTGGICVD